MISGQAKQLLAELAEFLRSATGRPGRKTWHRVGWHTDPEAFVPWERCSWENRFDDPNREYRTLYCAETRLTAIRELLAPLRPNMAARADYAAFQRGAGVPEDERYEPAKRVTRSWRAEHALVEVAISRTGSLYSLDEPAVRSGLERDHVELLRQHGMDNLDISQVRSKDRIVTQTIGRDLFEQDAAGMTFGSNIDDGRCVVIFEGRATLERIGEPVSLLEPLEELTQVCREWGLILEG